MDVNQAFPLTGKIVRGAVGSLLVVVIFYLAIWAAARVLSGLLGWIPVVGWILRVIYWLAGIYCIVGIIFACLQYFRSAD